MYFLKKMQVGCMYKDGVSVICGSISLNFLVDENVTKGSKKC